MYYTTPKEHLKLTQFTRTLSNSEAELKKKRVAYSKKRVFIYREVFDLHGSASRFTPFLSKYTNSLYNKKS